MLRLKFLLVLIVVITLSGCQSSLKEQYTTEITESRKQYEELESKYNIISESYNILKKDNNDLTYKIVMLENKNKDLSERISLLENKEVIKEDIEEKEYTVLYNVYDPNKIKIGDEINGFIVMSIDLDKEGDFERVKFEGYCILKCKIMIDAVGHDGLFTVYCNNKEIESELPISTTKLNYTKYEDGGSFYDISSESDDYISEQLGEERFNNMLIPQEQTYNITALFKDLDYVYLPNTDWASGLKIVKILSIE